MNSTIVSPGSIPEFVHPPVPGESHDFYGDTHLSSIKLPASAAIHSPTTSTQSRPSQFLDPLANIEVLNSHSSNSHRNNRNPYESELSAGTNLVEGAEQTEDDILWAKLVEGCINGQTDLVQEILTQSPKLQDSVDNISSATGMNPLHFAASRGHVDIVRILVDQAGAGVDIQDREGERGANVHQRDKDGWTALHNASSRGFIEIAQVLLDKGEADVNARSKLGHTPLINAASKGDVAMVLYFLNHAQANPLLKNAFSEMAYDVAAANSEAYLCGILQSSEKQYWKNEHTGDQVYDPLVIHSTILMTVHENQRATSSFPLSLMAPKFSASALAQQDIGGPWSLPNGRPSTKDDVHLPLIASSGATNSRANMQRGWFWLTEWVIDKTDPNVDSEGWQYGKSFTDVNQQWSAVPPTSGSNWVRRRKWIRVMKKRVDLVSSTGDPIEVSDSEQLQYHQELAGNYIKRSKLALRPDEGFQDRAQELARYRQAIQILLSGIKVDKDTTSKQAASVLVGEYLQHAEELAELIEQQDMNYANVHQLETPRPQIASRSSEGSIGSNNELRSLTLQKSRPSDLDALDDVFHSHHGDNIETQSQGSGQGSFASSASLMDAFGRIHERTEGIVQEHNIPSAHHSQEQDIHEFDTQEQSFQDQSERFEEEFSNIAVNGEQNPTTEIDDVSLETPAEQVTSSDSTAENIPNFASNSHQQVPELAVISASPATVQSDQFPIARLSRSPRPTMPSSPSRSSTQPINDLSSSFPGQTSTSLTQIPSSNVRLGAETTRETDNDVDEHTGASEVPRQFSSSFPTPSSFTSQERVPSSRVQSMQASTLPQHQLHHHQHSQSQNQIHTPSPTIEAKWESDHKAIECRECHRKFSLWLRRHHCRRCGHVVCDRCSSHRAMLHPSMVVYDPSSSEAYLNHQALARRGTVQSYRVCDSCYTSLGPPRSFSLNSASGSGSGSQSNSGPQLQHHRVFHSHTTTQNSYKPQQNDGNLGVYQNNSGYAPELTSHSSSRSSSSSNLQSTPMARNASSSSLMSECPVCGAILAGLEGGKTAQEAHVQDCLEGKSGQGSGPVRYVVYKLPADSPLIDQECAICFEEFVAGMYAYNIGYARHARR
ncbi:hypothetical protein BGZ49_009807 [Haplosporangium sp. Z 27]|nr:hypothetical protein BGZ49_009807 [Haplosporangium sp. Z 27]